MHTVKVITKFVVYILYYVYGRKHVKNYCTQVFKYEASYLNIVLLVIMEILQFFA